MSPSGLGRLLEDGEIIVRQGESGDCMFAIQDGRLEVIKTGKRGDVQVAVLGKGDIFGEMSIFEKEVRSATVKALGRARVLTVDKRTFLRRVQEDPTLAFNLVRMMSQRIRKLSAELATEEERRSLKDRRKQERRSKNRRKGDGSN